MKVSISALSVVTLLALAPAAQAEDFPATPLNRGAPTNLPGEALVPGLPEAAALVNSLTQPILQPILAPDAPAAAGTPAPHRSYRRHHRKVYSHLRRRDAHRSA